MKTKTLKLEDRQGFKLNLISNLNYYGNLDAKSFGQPVKKIVSSVDFEELKCISYNPNTRELRATVHIKSETGYLGNHCKSGSYEYVRFYIDYKNDGTWEDLGVTSFKIHNIEDHDGLCYGVKLNIKPKHKKTCDDAPVLPNVRAILSWNVEPPVDTPDYKPTWGNVKEARIQIAPRFKFWPVPAPIDLLDVVNPLASTLPVFDKTASFTKIDVLKKQYKGKVDDARLATMVLKNVNTNFSLKDIVKSKKLFEAAKVDFSSVLDGIIHSKFNTTYEELKCIGLNRKLNELHADIQIKKASGYSGDLCSAGSKEYVAFYMDFGAGWQFMGTSSVKVFDIDEIPTEDGLWYNAFLPVNLTPYQKEFCKEGKARIKGILSWNTPPTPHDPDFVATWGDWEVCNAEIKPLPEDLPSLTNQPWIESLGGVDNEIIDQVTGLAKGPSLLPNNITADYSPFDGNVYITGTIINQSFAARYKIMIKEPGGSFLAFNKNFTVRVRTTNTLLGTESSANVLQQPDSNSFYEYLPKSTGTIQKHVNGNILSLFRPTTKGMHEFYIESQTGEKSETVKFMVDKDIPSVSLDITSGTGNCGKFSIGEEIKGTFRVENDRHLDYVRLRLAPHNPSGTIELVSIDTISFGDVATDSGSLTISIDDQDSNLDYITGEWKIDTSSLPACGYTIEIRAVDRTIVSSSVVGKYSPRVTRGFCLE